MTGQPLAQARRTQDAVQARRVGARILARSLYRQLRRHSYRSEEILTFSTELIAQVVRELREADPQPE